MEFETCTSTSPAFEPTTTFTDIQVPPSDGDEAALPPCAVFATPNDKFVHRMVALLASTERDT